MSRGNARQKIFCDDRDYTRRCKRLREAVERYGLELLTFVFMPNHVHLFFVDAPSEPVAGHAISVVRICELVRQTASTAGPLVGLNYPGSVRNLLRRAETTIAKSKRLRKLEELNILNEENLAPSSWSRTRKQMKKSQIELDFQQTY